MDILPTKGDLGQAAARRGAEAINAAIAARGEATICVATGASQFDTMAQLVREDVDFSRVTAFHLDEYVGISPDHPASFRRYLAERFCAELPGLKRFVAINGDAADLDAELRRLNDLIAASPVDVCFAGIGENGHLAFNDPPADFATAAAFHVVDLDLACRAQQLGEGWFPSIEDVPVRAISMSVPQIMKSGRLVLSVPDARKAEAVRRAVRGAVTPQVPASIVQSHPDAWLYLDPPAAEGLG